MILGRFGADSDVGSSFGTAWNYTDEVVFPFGYGLSYTTFEQTLDSVEVGEDTVTVTVTVTNTGEVAGKSAVQVYEMCIRDSYYGEAMAVIRPNGKGDVHVMAQSPFGDAEATVRCAPD